MIKCLECSERKATRNGLCHRCYQRIWAKAHYNSTKKKETRRKWLEANIERCMWLGAKHSARRRELEFTITISDIVIPIFCPVLGLKLTRHSGGETSPSLDRKNNTVGYTPDNIQVISSRANRLKSDSSVEEIEKILRYMKSY